jgi:RNA polymerase sigma-70 factor (ECF subfamily)
MNGSGRHFDPSAPVPGRFDTTRWSLVLTARDGCATEGRDALAALCSAYWYPLYAFVRRKGHDAEAAQDVVQGFFARLLEKGDLAGVDPGKGKFRSFLMASCTHYLANQRDRQRARKRGSGKTPIPIDRLSAEDRYDREPSHGMTAERLFERNWAITLLDQVLNRLRDEQERAGKARQFEALRPALLGGAERVPFARIAAELELSEEAARASAHRLRRRLRELVREEVARTIGDDADVEEEIRALFSALTG